MRGVALIRNRMTTVRQAQRVLGPFRGHNYNSPVFGLRDNQTATVASMHRYRREFKSNAILFYPKWSAPSGVARSAEAEAEASVSGGVESDVPEAQDMGPLPPYTGDQPDETTLSTSKKLVLLVVALVVFHLIAVVSK